MTVTEHIRANILRRLRRADSPKNAGTPLEILDSNFSWRFIVLMANRMIFGHFRYGTTIGERVKGPKVWNVKAIEKHLAAYKRAGNVEHLVDIGNYAMVEFENPSHPRHHFKAEDDGEHAERRLI